MKKTIITALVLVGIFVATPALALYVARIDTPVVRIAVNNSYTGDYHIYKYEEGDTDCFVVTSTEYKTQVGISCVKDERAN